MALTLTSPSFRHQGEIPFLSLAMDGLRCSAKPAPARMGRFATSALVLAFVGGLVACAGARSAGTRTKGGHETGTAVEGFVLLDEHLASRLGALEDAVGGLRRSLTVQSKRILMSQTLPTLRQMVEEGWARLSEASLARDAGLRARKLQEAGRHYQAALITSQVLWLEVTLLRLADGADEAGQPSAQIAAQLRGFDADMEPLMDAVRSMDRDRLAAELERAGPKFQGWLRVLERWEADLRQGGQLSQDVILIADLLMLGASAYHLSRIAHLGGRPGPPPVAFITAGGAATAARVDAEALRALLKMIEKLIAAGALDAPVVMGLATMTAGPRGGGTNFAMQADDGWTLPSRAPDPNAKPRGPRAKPHRRDGAVRARGLGRENDSADAIARSGYDIEQLPQKSKGDGVKAPDFRIEGRIFDNYAPTTGTPRNIWRYIDENKVNPKIGKRQTDRVVINLTDSPVNFEALKKQFMEWPMPNLKEVWVVTADGTVVHLWP